MAWRLAAALLLAVMLSAGGRAHAVESPAFELSDVAPPVREAIERAQARLEQARAGEVGSEAAAWGHLGDVALAHQFSSQARVAYQAALQLDPERHDWHYLLGLLENSEGNTAAAITAYNRALALQDNDPLIRLRRGQARLQAGDLEAAQRDFQAVLEQQPDTSAAIGGLGRIALQRDQFQQAIDYLQRALELSPQADRLHHLLGMAYRGAGNVEQARHHLGQRGETDEPVEDPLMARVQRESRNPQFYLELGLGRAEAGDLDSAVRLLAEAAQLAPEEPRILTNFGEALARNGQLEQAYAVFRRLANLEPSLSEPHYYLGQIEELRGNTLSAVQSYRHLIGMTPEDAQARAALAWALLDMKQFEEAAERFAQAQQLSEQPAQQAQYAYWQGMAALALGRCQPAQRLFEQARSLAQPPSPDLLSALARVRASCAQGEPAELREALGWAEAIYQASPGLSSAETLAMVYARLGQYSDAVDLQAQAIFEALKAGQLESRPWLQENMQNYRNEQAAERPYGVDDPSFSARLGG